VARKSPFGPCFVVAEEPQLASDSLTARRSFGRLYYHSQAVNPSLHAEGGADPWA